MNHDPVPGDGVPLPKDKSVRRSRKSQTTRGGSQTPRRAELHHTLPASARGVPAAAESTGL